jgi:hypothetical protein
VPSELRHHLALPPMHHCSSQLTSSFAIHSSTSLASVLS